MVSASTSVNAGVGPRLRRRVSPRICRTASSITQYSQTKRSSRSMDGPPQGSGALKTVPHRPIPRGRLFEVTHSASLNRGKPEVRVGEVFRPFQLAAGIAGSIEAQAPKALDILLAFGDPDHLSLGNRGQQLGQPIGHPPAFEKMPDLSVGRDVTLVELPTRFAEPVLASLQAPDPLSVIGA